MTRPFFSRDRISEFDLFDLHADQAIRLIKDRITPDSPEDKPSETMVVDIQDIASRYTLDTATSFLFGSNVESLSAGLPYPPITSPLASSPSYAVHASSWERLNELRASHPANKFAKAFDQAQILSASRSQMGVHWPLREFFRDRTRPRIEEVDRFIRPLIRNSVEKMRKKGVVPGKVKKDEDRVVEEGETLLDHLVHYTTGKEAFRPSLGESTSESLCNSL
jgi:hypothetical protein